MRRCLDSWAVLRWLEGVEPAATRVAKALDQRPVMSVVNAGEVFYIVRRQAGDEAAVEVLDTLRARVQLDPVDEARAVQMARIKADHRMALGDAFAAATAQAYGVRLLTGDPELLAKPRTWDVQDLR